MSGVLRVFDNMQDVVLIIDGNRGLRYGNEAAALLLDVSARRLSSGRPLDGVITFAPDILENGQFLETVEAPTQMREIRFATGAGKEGWAQVLLQRLPSEISEASGAEGESRWLIYFRDVTLEKNLHDKYKAELDQKEAVIEDLRKAQGELSNYSKNLERMVQERTAELREANRLLATILDSLGQGIFVFNAEGTCLPVHSKVCESLFGVSPSGLAAVDVLKLEGSARETFAKWTEAVFGELLDFEDLVPLAPSRLNSAGSGRHVALGYNRMLGDDGSLKGVVLVATDKTEEMRARLEAERERSLSKRILTVVQHRQQFRLFALEARRICAQLSSAAVGTGGLDTEEIVRFLHTIKGGAASFGLNEIAQAAHSCEDRIASYAKLGETAWPHELLESLAAAATEMNHELEKFVREHAGIVGNLEAVGRQVEIPVERLQVWRRQALVPAMAPDVAKEILEAWVLEPAAKTFSHVDAGLVELANQLGKRLRPLRIEGGDLKILPEAFAGLFGTFIHAFRNSVDHGIEPPLEREAAGKPPEGTITVEFRALSTPDGQRRVAIEIRDDGRGIDPGKIRAKLAERGVHVDAHASDDDVIQAVFRDDFSTAECVTEISGRGVGMSAIKAEAERMGGSCRVLSIRGRGSILRIEVPDPSRSGAPPRVSSHGAIHVLASEPIKKTG